MTAPVTMFFTCIFFAYIISIGRFHTEPTAGEVHGQIHLKNMLWKAYSREPTTAFFVEKRGSPGAFRCLFEVFLLRGGTPETSGKTPGTFRCLKVPFWSHFGSPWAPLWAPLGVFGEPWVPHWAYFSTPEGAQREKSSHRVLKKGFIRVQL